MTKKFHLKWDVDVQLLNTHLDKTFREENLNGFLQQGKQPWVMDADTLLQQWQ